MMDAGQSIFANVRRHLNLLEKCKAAALLEEETALANAQKNLEISRSTQSSLESLTCRFQAEQAKLEDEYQQKKAALDRENEEKKAALDATLEQQLNEIKTAEAQQRSSLQDENSIRRRRAARALQEKLAEKEWIYLCSKIEALGIPTKGFEDPAVFLTIPELLVTLQKCLERVDTMAGSATKKVQESNGEVHDIQTIDRDSIGYFMTRQNDRNSTANPEKGGGVSGGTPNHTLPDKALDSTTIRLDEKEDAKPSEAGQVVDENSPVHGKAGIDRRTRKKERVKKEKWSEHSRKQLLSSYRPEYQIPSKSTTRIDEPQKIERKPIDERCIDCPYINISKQHIPVSQEILNEMRYFFKEHHATHILADETGYYILFDTSRRGNQHMTSCHLACGKKSLSGYKLVLHPHRSKRLGYSSPAKDRHVLDRKLRINARRRR